LTRKWLLRYAELERRGVIHEPGDILMRVSASTANGDVIDMAGGFGTAEHREAQRLDWRGLCKRRLADVDRANKQMYDNISGFKLLHSATVEGPGKEEQQKVIDQMSKFMAITMLKQQKKLETKKADDDKQNYYHCAVYKSLPPYDNEKAGAPTIAAFLENIAYGLIAHVKSA
jgi:hypothetical protein